MTAQSWERMKFASVKELSGRRSSMGRPSVSPTTGSPAM